MTFAMALNLMKDDLQQSTFSDLALRHAHDHS